MNRGMCRCGAVAVTSHNDEPMCGGCYREETGASTEEVAMHCRALGTPMREENDHEPRYDTDGR